MKKLSLGVVTTFFLAVGSAASQQTVQPNHLTLERMGVMFVGGREVAMSNEGRFGGQTEQTQIAEQAPVHYLIPPADIRDGKRPIIMIPGMGLTSYLYLGTPDGRDGWAQLFAKQGYPVYVFDEPNNAISGFDIGRFTNVDQPARVMLWSNEMTWRRWGIGPEPGVPASNTRFPYEQIDQLHASMTAVIGGGRGGRGRARGGQNRSGRGRGGRGNRRDATPARDGLDEEPSPIGDEAIAQLTNPKVVALIELLEQVGPATIIMHSASGPTAFETTRVRPELVHALVAIEVTGTPSDPDDVETNFSTTPFLGIYGDNFDLRPMQGRLEASQRMADVIKEVGGTSELIWLPERGIEGNSHLLMQDDNNDVIANMVMEFLVETARNR